MNIPIIHPPNFCIVVWQQLICWLVLLGSLSLYLLDVVGSRTRKSFLISKGHSLHIKLCIMFSVFVHVYGHKRGQTSLSVVGNKIKSNRYSQSSVRNFERKLALLNTAKCSPCIVLMHCRKIRNQSHPLK